MSQIEIEKILERSKNGVPYASSRNLCIIVWNDPFFSDLYFDSMRAQPCRVNLETGIRTYWTDTDDAISRVHVEQTYGIRSPAKLDDAIAFFLANRRFSPVQECIKKFTWDGEPHCRRFFIKWLLADDSPYTEEVTRILFLQMIKRAFHPGCKADYVPVLKGVQGSGKSTICRWLALEDDLYASVSTIDGQRGYEAVQGKFVCELEELLATVGEGTRKDAQVKQFISGLSDFYRRPYDRRSSDNPRTCVFLGTTNRQRFLTDPTGNRRWFPIECRLLNGQYVYEHEQEVKEDIIQCLAEMYHAFNNNLPLASPVISRNLLNVVVKHQQDSELEDYRVGKIEDYIRKNRYDPGKEYICAIQLWKEALQNDRKDMTRADANEIGELLRLKLNCQPIGKKYFPAYGTQHAFNVVNILENGT